MLFCVVCLLCQYKSTIIMKHSNKSVNNTKEWVCEETAAEVLGITKRTLQNYVYMGKIPMKAVKKNVIGKRQYHAPTLQSPSNN